MDSTEFIALKRKPFYERIDDFYAYMEKERERGTMLGRVGFPPVGPIQTYKHPETGEPKELIMMGSNNYLGFSNEPEIKEKVIQAVQERGLGSGGSPAFSGYTIQQEELEKRLGTLSAHDSSVLVAGGYIANLTWLTGLIGKDDVLIYDKNSHASVIDAIKLSGIRHAFSLDTEKPEMLEKLLKVAVDKYAGSQIFMTVEGVRSIDGSVTEVKTLLDIAKKFDDRIFFMLDDAHGLGTLGETGKGTLEYLNMLGQVDLRMSTCSKAFGIQGAFLTANQKIVDYMKSMANPYNFTTAMSQPVIAGINAALDFIEEHPDRLRQLHVNKVYLQDRLEKMGFNIFRAPSGIIPIFIPDAPSEKINRALFENGLFANVMAYPMIAPGQERIRISVMATHTTETMDRALEILEMVGKENGVI